MPSTRKRQYRLQKLNRKIGLGWLNKWKKQNNPIPFKNNLKTIAGGLRDCILVFLSPQPTHWSYQSTAQTAEKIVTLRAFHIKLALPKFIKVCKSQLQRYHHTVSSQLYTSTTCVVLSFSFIFSCNKLLQSRL